MIDQRQERRSASFNVPFSLQEPPHDHVHNQPTTAEDNVDRHRYLVSERGIVQERYHVKQHNLHQVGQER